MLTSHLLSPNRRLNDCEVQDSAHVTPGDRGEHVGLIQQALFLIERASIDGSEVESATYGPSTAGAVLDYKTRRSIINRSYETSADSIVGKMTIKSLDDEMRDIEAQGTQPFFAGGLRPVQGRLT
jgi:hypothetical protein